MNVVVFSLLFVAGILLTAGAWLGHARGFCGIMGLFVWFVIGLSSSAIVVVGGAGSEHVFTEPAVAWLSYGNAAMHFVALIFAVHEALQPATDEGPEALDPDRIQQIKELTGADS
ncbi:hypothetical protein [Haloarcula argentinensis]|uniref:Uncharacterized protein n=1 Tax=Haloarcula argentinensis TaxID=43776 RepID=A0A830FRX3_HALAR|nr:hypothetical protein [Haloarcula argentinensis]GGM52510.1 hypothetical protein GCM10009006_37020 [Haloarcula argentinensis]